MRKLILLGLFVLALFLFFLLPDKDSHWEEEALYQDAITGQTTLTYQSCLDSDEGLDFDEKGNVEVQYTYNQKVKKVTLDDECADGILKEYYCSGKRHRLREHPCEVSCVEGACVS